MDLPKFEHLKFQTRCEYVGDKDLEKLISVCTGVYNMALFTRLKCEYMFNIMSVLPRSTSSFFPIVLHSFATSIVIDVFRLYDNGSVSISTVRNVLNGVHNGKLKFSKPIDGTILSSICASVISDFRVMDTDECKNMLENIKKLRNKAYAHNDYSNDFGKNDLMQQFGLCISEILLMLHMAGHASASILSVLCDVTIDAIWSDEFIKRNTTDVYMALAGMGYVVLSDDAKGDS